MAVARSIGGVLALALAACGGTTVIDAGGGSGGSDSTSASSGATSSSTATSGPTGQGGSSVGGGSAGPWRADMWIGQVDHMSIRHHDLASDVCVLMTATAPSGGGSSGISMPAPWGLDQVSVWDETSGCMDEQFTPSGPSANPDSASGSIDFVLPAMQFYPCELDVDATIQFANPPPWLPASLALQTSMLELQGACP